MDDRGRTDGWTREKFVKAGAGAVGLAIAGGAAYRWLGGEDTPQAVTTATTPPTVTTPDRPRGRVHAFVSRPDLKPPTVTVLKRASGTGEGYLFLSPPSGPGQRGGLIIDDAGEPIWFRPSTPDTTMDVRPGLYKGNPVLTWWEGRHIQGVGLRGAYVMVDESYREIARFRSRRDVPPDFHEVLLTPDDTLLVLSYDPVPANLSSVGGKRRGKAYDGVVQELEIPSGRVLWEWRSLDHVEVGESYQKQVANPYDYFHVNSAGFDSDGNLLISARNTWGIYKVDRRTGRVIWRLGGKRSDFTMGPGTKFAFQHDARSHDGGRLLSLFDNGPVPNTKRESRGLVLELDTERMRARLAQEIRHAPPLFARVTGNAQLAENGNFLICWGSTGYFTEYAEDGEVLFDAKLPRGGQNYRVHRFPWTGRPSEPPKLAAGGPGAGSRRLYVSWNGATDVASWRLRTGASEGDLSDATTTPKSGFETELEIPAGTRYAAAVALDADGEPLRTSNVVRV